jgi:hypothetical protein
MAEVNRETVTTVSQDTSNVPNNSNVVNRTTKTTVKNSYPLQNLVYFIFGVLEFLLLFRLVFKLVGANPSSWFVSFIYAITRPFILPFAGIFPTATTEGVVATSVLEPATLVAILVYPLIAWGIVKLIAIVNNDPEV